MNNLQLVSISGELPPNVNKVLKEGMLAYHASKGHPRKEELYSITLKNQSNKTLGVVMVCFLWQAMEIRSLWVDEAMRHQGWGRRLVEAAEQEALKRGCTLAHTNTFSWQAPGFYSKLGYTAFGKLDNYPEGHSLSYFKKDLR